MEGLFFNHVTRVTSFQSSIHKCMAVNVTDLDKIKTTEKIVFDWSAPSQAHISSTYIQHYKPRGKNPKRHLGSCTCILKSVILYPVDFLLNSGSQRSRN